MTGRLDSMQAVVLDAKLDIFEEELALRQTVADRYQTLIGDVVDVPRLAAGYIKLRTLPNCQKPAIGIT